MIEGFKSMKKIVLLVLMTFKLFAYDDYIGVGLGYSELKGINIENDGMSFSVALGHKYGDHGRLHASATYIYYDDPDISGGSYSLAYDFLLPVTDNLEVYLGPVIGYSTYDQKNYNDSIAHVGVEAGILFELTKNIELEVGYNFLSGQTKKAYFQANFFFDASKRFKYE